MEFTVRHLEPFESFTILDKELNAHMIDDLQYLDSGCDAYGMWYARVTATAQGVKYCGSGCSLSRDWAKILASNAAFYCLGQGRAEGLSNTPAFHGSPSPPTSGSLASALSSTASTKGKCFLSTPDTAAVMEENEKLRSKNAELEEYLEEARKVRLSVQDQNAKAVATVTELQQEIDDQNAILRDAFLQSREQDARITRLERHLAIVEWSRNVAVQGSRLPVQILERDLEQERVADADGAAALRAIIESYKLKALGHQGQVEDLKSTIRRLEAQVTSLAGQLEQRRKERKKTDAVSQTVLQGQGHLIIQRLREESEDLKTKVKCVSEELKTWKGVMRGLNNKILEPGNRCRWLEEDAFSVRKYSDSDTAANIAKLGAAIEHMCEVTIDHDVKNAQQKEELRDRVLKIESLEDKVHQIRIEREDLLELELRNQEQIEELDAYYDGEVSDHFEEDDIVYL